MLMVRSLLFNIVMFTSGFVLCSIWLPSLIMPRMVIVKGAETWMAVVMFSLKHICKLDFELRGLEYMPKEGPVLLAMKHQSMWDTLILHHVLKDPAIIMKKELAWLPLFGREALKAGMISVNRGSKSVALRSMLESAKLRVAEKRPIVIYPEGTRKSPGDIPAYKHGIAAMYNTLHLRCIPVAVNSGHYWGRRDFVKRPGTIVMEFLPPIEPGLKRHAFMTTLEQRLEEASDKLAEEAIAQLAAQK